jgi:putative ABC transport system permease protein
MPLPHAPRLARACLSALLPADARSSLLAELDHEYLTHVRPAAGRLPAHLWYWRQALASIPSAIAMRQRRRRKQTLNTASPRQVTPRQWLDQSVQDVRYGLRSLRRRPGFAAAAIATFALGIGANTAIFSIVDAVVLRPLPYDQPDRLIRVWSANPRGIARNRVSPANFFDFRDQAAGPHALESLAAFTAGDASTMRGRGEPVRITTSMVSPTMFALLAAKPFHGRTLGQSDALPNASSVVVISHQFWQSRFGGAPTAVGSGVTLDGEAATIVGVMPPAFDFPSRDVDMWVPLPERLRSGQRSAHYLDVVGRLSPGVSPESAASVLRAVAARIEAEHPAMKGWGVTVTTLHDSLVGAVRRPLLVLLAGVGCVLLIACANVTSLLLARGISREREMAVRAALGASRGRIARQQFVESAVIAGFGGLAGLGLAWAGLQVFRASASVELPRAAAIGIDVRVLLATLTLSVAAAIVTGFAPAWRATHGTANDSLKSGRDQSSGRSTRRSRSILVSVEIALTLALVICAGLLGRSFVRLTHVDAGFRADSTLLAQVNLAISKYEPEVWSSFASRALEAIRVLPGVTVAGAGAPLPLSGEQGLMRFGVRIEGRPDPPPGQNDRAYLRWATPGYFRAMGIPLLEGRAFADSDRADAARVAIVDRAFVERYFPGADPVGQRIRPTNEREFRQIVGVVGGVRPTRLEDPPEPHLYVPQSQNPSASLTFVIRSDGDPVRLAAPVREAIRSIDPEQPVFNVRTLEDMVTGSVAAQRFNALLIALFAYVAVLLMVVGIYGLIAGWVNESTRDLGLRLALGATPGEIFSFVIGRGLRLAAIGTAAGLALAFFASRLLSGLLFGVEPWDPLVFGGSTLLVTIAAVAASYLPARRAVAIDPAVALRGE